MLREKLSVNDLGEYIAGYPLPVQEMMTAIRRIIHSTVPDVEEKISWRMAAFGTNKNKKRFYFAGCKNHIGIYPGPEILYILKNEISAYKTSKGGLQVPYNKPLPVELVTKIVQLALVG